MYWSTDKNVMTGGSQEPNLVFPLGAMVQYLLISVQGDFREHNYGE